jgi:hypothetical protein
MTNLSFLLVELSKTPVLNETGPRDIRPR